MEVEFWSTSFAAPETSLLNLLVELVGNYPPMPLVTQKNVSFYSPFYSPEPCPSPPPWPAGPATRRPLPPAAARRRPPPPVARRRPLPPIARRRPPPPVARRRPPPHPSPVAAR